MFHGREGGEAREAAGGKKKEEYLRLGDIEARIWK